MADMLPGHDPGAFYKVDPDTGAVKQVKSARYDLIPTEPLRQLAEHYGHGATHYTDRNWEKGNDWNDYYASMQRHANAWWGGEDMDSDGFPHMVAVAWYAFAFLEYATTHPEKDNRPRKKNEAQDSSDQTTQREPVLGQEGGQEADRILLPSDKQDSYVPGCHIRTNSAQHQGQDNGAPQQDAQP